MIRRGPFQILYGRDEARFKPAALLHLLDGQSFAPLTATRLRKVREWTSIGLKSAEALEDSIAHCRREAGMHLGDVYKFAALIIADQALLAN